MDNMTSRALGLGARILLLLTACTCVPCSLAGEIRPLFYDMRVWANPASVTERRIAYQRVHAVVALQGILNRDQPRLMVGYLSRDGIADLDLWWYEQARALECFHGVLGEPEIVRAEERDPIDLIAAYTDDVAGLVVWDPSTPATALVASTLAGKERLIPVTPSDFPGSLKGDLEKRGFQVRRDLTAIQPPVMTGSRKCDWYRWVLDNLLAEGGSGDPGYLAYYVDGFAMDDGEGHWGSVGLVNHDLVISRGGYFLDLSMWDDEAPNDDPGQLLGSDYDTLNRFLDRLREQAGRRLIRGYGFSPWQYKYSDWRGHSKHATVDGEWRFVKLFSRRNIVIAESDAAAMVDCPNGSFWRHFAPDGEAALNDERNAARTPLKPGTKTICWLMGDYDSSAWMTHWLPTLWNDPARGQVPLAWMMNPVCFERAPHILQVLRAGRSPMDHFVAYEGLGYIDPNESRDLETLGQVSREQFAKYNLSIIGYMINPPSMWITPEAVRVYRRFAPDGMGFCGPWFKPRMDLSGVTPLVQSVYLSDFHETDAAKVANILRENADQAGDFLLVRAIQVSPSFVADVMGRLNADGERFQAVDPYTFFGAVRQWLAEGRPAR